VIAAVNRVFGDEDYGIADERLGIKARRRRRPISRHGLRHGLIVTPAREDTESGACPPGLVTGEEGEESSARNAIKVLMNRKVFTTNPTYFLNKTGPTL
jgi:hypothetical protein